MRSAVLTEVDCAQKDCEDLSSGSLVDLSGKAAPSSGRTGTRKMFGQSGGSNRSSGGSATGFRISALSPYLQQKNWKLKVRCTEKNDIKEWNNAKGSGKLFPFTIMDNFGDEIKVTAFGDEADKFFNLIHQDKLYTFSKGRIQVNKFKGRVKNEYCIICTRETVIEPVREADASFASKSYNFVAVNALENVEENSFVDMIACVKEVGEIREFTSKAGKELKNRKLIIVDTSGASIEATLWNEQATKYTQENISPGMVVVLPGCRVGSFGGRSLSAREVIMNFKSDQYTALEKWWKEGGSEATATSMTVRGQGGVRSQLNLNWAEALEQRMGENAQDLQDYKGDWFNLRGTITHIPVNMERPPYYKACPASADSMAKVEPDDNGKFYCAKTGQTYDSYLPRFILRFTVADPSDGKFVSSFNNQAESILGFSATEVDKAVVAGNEDDF
eukprot:UN06880